MEWYLFQTEINNFLDDDRSVKPVDSVSGESQWHEISFENNILKIIQ